MRSVRRLLPLMLSLALAGCAPTAASQVQSYGQTATTPAYGQAPPDAGASSYGQAPPDAGSQNSYGTDGRGSTDAQAAPSDGATADPSTDSQAAPSDGATGEPSIDSQAAPSDGQQPYGQPSDSGASSCDSGSCSMP